MRSALLCLSAVAGCNQLFDVQSTQLLPDADLRPDRDHDGIADLEDPCIASEADLVDDFDEDMMPNGSDSCPLLAVTTDGDGDGVGDYCDPFGTRAGDRVRCTMRFLDIELSASLWKPRDGEEDFALSSGYLVGFEQPPPKIASIIAQERITSTSGTTMVDVGVSTLVPELPFVFRLWASAGATPSASDVGCEAYGDPAGYAVKAIGGTNPMEGAPILGMPGAGGLVRVIVQPGKAGPNVLCMVQFGTEATYATTRLEGELEQQGFAVIAGAIVMSAVVVIERDDQPSL